MLHASERLEVHFEDMSIPISVKELEEWTEGKNKKDSEIAAWLDLLGFKGREGLVKFLQEPFLKDNEMALELLRSWFGRKLLDEIGSLIKLDDDNSGTEIFKTFENLLLSSTGITVLDLFRAIPSEVIHLDLDEMVKVANGWRRELKIQQKLVSNLAAISEKKKNSEEQKITSYISKESSVELLPIKVPHRSDYITLEIWTPSKEAESRSNLIIFMPGLGGDQAHFRWLSRSLSNYGWPVVVLQHPGSDSKSVKDLLQGKIPAPGLEVIPNRLADLKEVLKSPEVEDIKVSGKGIILMGHSLGSLISFLASGADPQKNLNERCSKALNVFSLTNLSALLQCQLAEFSLPERQNINSLSAIVGINSFGSLLWPRDSRVDITIPFLLTGGTFDLVTPAIYEQLGLLLATKKNKYSRVLLIEGASHFSPIRVKDQLNKSLGEDVFKLDETLVGVEPISVQNLLASEITRFLINLEKENALEPEINMQRNNISFHLLDRSLVKSLIKN